MPFAFRHGRVALSQAWVVFACLANVAHADEFKLGEITTATSLAIGHDSLSGAFADSFTFSIGVGQAFDFDAFVSTGYSRRSAIFDLQGQLYRGTQWLLEGDATTRYSPEGFPERDVDFAPSRLGAGDYRLTFTGTAQSLDPSLPFTSGYEGSIAFSAAPGDTPEPATLALMTLGLAAVGMKVRRRPLHD